MVSIAGGKRRKKRSPESRGIAPNPTPARATAARSEDPGIAAESGFTATSFWLLAATSCLLEARGQKPAASSLLLKRHIHQQLIALDVDHVAEGAVAAASKVEVHAAASHAQVPDAQVIEEPRQ